MFGYDTNGKMYYVNTAGTGQITMAGQFSSSYAGWTSSAAMFRPGKILQMGGNSNGSVVIDITGPQPVVTPVTAADVLEAAMGVRDGARRRPRACDRRQRGRQPLNDVNTSAEIWDPDYRISGPSGPAVCVRGCITPAPCCFRTRACW